MPFVMRYFFRRVVRNPSASLRVGVLLIAVLLYGTTGFIYFELETDPSLTWADGVWYTVVTITTVGYGDLYPVTAGGRYIVAMPLMFFGIGLLGYLLSVAASALVEAKTKELHGMAEHKLKGHLIIFNFPGLSKVESVIAELRADPSFGKDTEIVLIDEDLPELPPELLARDVHYVRGNPARDETLERAAIDEARFAVVLSRLSRDPRSDDQNVAIALAVEARAPDVYTVVECVDATTEELLRKAGSDGVVCSSRFDSHFVSHELMNPGAQDVVAQLTSSLEGGQQVYMTRYEGAKAVAFSKLVAKCAEAGHIALGIRHDGRTEINVSGDRKVAPDDDVITIGQARLSALS